ncbi:methyltransferase domain-containing protein [Rhodopseudomonas sp. RCAM05734]|uniref:methyltransferase domain-containing protein n=1 Tax=Rhodopseudomonas sp. RCAM05734 TaxID=3457549 RepID=UPI0040448DA8
MDFQCNVCGTEVKNCPVENIDREIASCPTCNSSVRIRSIAHLLSMALFGRSMPVTEFPADRSIVGIGLSDGLGYAQPIAERLGYTNTFFHQEPFFDICAPVGDRAGTCDFMISTEVFEHVAPPAQTAFQHAFDVLKPGGTLLLTVPFTNNPETVEHFPELDDYRTLQFGDEYVLVNRAVDGQYTMHRNLVFHGGPGTTLEMRVYSRSAVEKHLADAGFVDVQVFDQDIPKWGILHRYPWSLPIVATRPQTDRRSAIKAPRGQQTVPTAGPTRSTPPSGGSALAMLRDIPSLALIACVALGIFGLVRSGLLAEVLWQPSLIQQTQFLFAGVAAAGIAACIVAVRLRLRPETVLGLLIVLIAAALCGPAPAAIVLAFLLSSWCLGAFLLSRAGTVTNNLPAVVTIVAGWAVFAIGFALLASVPVNTTATHTLILAVPIALALARPGIRSDFRAGTAAAFTRLQSPNRPGLAYLAGLVFTVVILSFHLAMVALPERYFDAMAMHLYIPSYISAHRAWSYDVANYAFAYTPIGADMLYAHMFLLQGEAAARLLNFTAFAFTCLVTFQIAARCCARSSAIWAVALLVSVPLTLIESATLFVENTAALFITTTVLVLIAANFRIRIADYLAIIILIAAASAVKLHGAIVAALLGPLAAFLLFRTRTAPRPLARFAIITAAGIGAALWPYLYAWTKTGNPVLPLFNNIFKSPFFPPVEFVDSRWIGKFSPSFLYDATFATGGFVEAYNGALGFTFLVFLAAGIFAAIQRRDRIALFCGGFGLFLIVMLSVKTQYLRYLLIFFPLLVVVVAVAIDHLRQIRLMRFPLAIVIAAVALLNVYKMPAGGWILGVSDLRACCSENLRRQLELGQAPERIANRILNEAAGPLAKVLYVGNPFGGLLTGIAIYSAWYNTAFGTEFASVTTEEQFASLMTRVRPTHVVFDTSGLSALEKSAGLYLSAKATLLNRIGRLAIYQLPI